MHIFFNYLLKFLRQQVVCNFHQYYTLNAMYIVAEVCDNTSTIQTILFHKDKGDTHIILCSHNLRDIVLDAEVNFENVTQSKSWMQNVKSN